MVNKAPFLVIQPVEVPSELWHASVIPKPHREAPAVVPFQHTWLANVGAVDGKASETSTCRLSLCSLKLSALAG